MSKSIYDQHRDAFASVSAYVILKDGERVASIALKFPRDGAGRLYAYVHFFGMPMVRGFAGGYGYDKRSAAVRNAFDKIAPEYFTHDDYGNTWEGERAACLHFRDAILNGKDGYDWEGILRDAGYTVLQAV